MPYPNEHACRLLEPTDKPARRKAKAASIGGHKVDHLYQEQEDGKWALQAVRFPRKAGWAKADAADAAQEWCEEHEGSFEMMMDEGARSAPEEATMPDPITPTQTTAATHIMSLPAELRAFEDTARGDRTRIVEGTCSTQSRDRHKTCISAIALERAAPGYLRNPVYCYNHQWGMPIGATEAVERRGEAMFTRARLLPADACDELTDAVWSRIENGILRGQSVGWNGDWRTAGAVDKRGVFWWGKEDGSGDLDWVDVSVVSIPSNTDTDDLRIARSLGMDDTQPWLDAPEPQERAWGGLSADAIRETIAAALNGNEPGEVVAPGVASWWVYDLYEDYAIAQGGDGNKALRISYAVVDGAVVLGERVEVTKEWVAVRMAESMPLLGDLPAQDIGPDAPEAVWRVVAAAACRVANDKSEADLAPTKAFLRECYARMGKEWPSELDEPAAHIRDIPWQHDEQYLFEEGIFADGFRRASGLIEGNRNIVRKWQATGRVLSPEYVAEVGQVASHAQELAAEIIALQQNAAVPPSENRIAAALREQREARERTANTLRAALSA